MGHTRPLCPLKKHKPTSLCYVPRPEFTVRPEKQPDAPLTTVKLNGKPVTALLDTGCSQSLVQSHLIPREMWNDGDSVPVICVHGHEEQSPTADVYIETKGQVYLMKVGVAPELPYPILLGTDLPVLYDLINESQDRFCGVVTRARARQAPLPEVQPPVSSVSQQAGPPVTREAGSVTAPLPSTPDTQPDTLLLLPFHGEEVGEPTLTQEDRLERRREQVQAEGLTPQFTEQAGPEVPAPELQLDSLPCDLAKCQREDSTLVQCFKEAEKEHSVFLPHHEHYVMENDILYRVSEEGRQLVLPKSCREEVLRVGHTVPWVTWAL